MTTLNAPAATGLSRGNFTGAGWYRIFWLGPKESEPQIVSAYIDKPNDPWRPSSWLRVWLFSPRDQACHEVMSGDGDLIKGSIVERICEEVAQ